jgi:hypothetical protein
MFPRLASPAGRGTRTRLASEVPLKFQMYQTLQFMTVSLRSINIMLSPMIRRIPCVSSACSKHVGNGHGGNGHGGNGNGTGNGNGKGPTHKSLTRSIAVLATKFDKFNLQDDDDDKSSEEEEGT